MGIVPESVIQEVRERTDLIELVGSSVALRRAGRGFVGLCPFHQEKTGSFHVNPERGIYHCFGCGVTGDAFRFLMERDHMSFPEALEELARRAGVELKYDKGQKGAPPGENERLVRAHEIAAHLYVETLAAREGEAARAEIARRRFTPEMVLAYRLGAAPPAWERLVGRARREGIASDVLERAGLALRRDDGTHYDRFRDRIMFPIEAMGPRVIAFGGRVLGEDEPKYLNSPETPLFRKRKTLYGLPQASTGMRASREAILVEGYMDVLALASAGFANAVGALGTAFSTEHAQVLARAVDRVVVVFDGDAAGTKAMLASAGPLVGAGLEVRVVLLPEGEDPDSFVRTQGAEAFRAALEKSRGVVDALLGDEAYESAAGRDRALRRALSALSEIDDPLRRRVHVQEVAERTRVSVDLLEERLATMRERDRAPAPREEAPHPAARVERAGARAAQPGASAAASRRNALDRALLALLLHHERLAPGILEHIADGELEDPVVARIVAHLAEHAAQGGIPSTPVVLEEFRDDGEAAALLGEIAVSDEFRDGAEQLADDCARGLKQRAIHKESTGLDREIRKAKAQGDDRRVDELTAELFQLRIRLEALRRESVTGER